VGLAQTGFGSPDLPARSGSQYRLSYPGPLRTFAHMRTVNATQQRQSVSAHHTYLTMKGDSVMRFGGGTEIFIRISAELNTILFGCQKTLSGRKERFLEFHAL
jgi:hypothetical protein